MEIEENKKDKKSRLMNFLLWGGLGLLIVFVIATSIILHTKKSEAARLKRENDAIKQTEEIIRVIN